MKTKRGRHGFIFHPKMKGKAAIFGGLDCKNNGLFAEFYADFRVVTVISAFLPTRKGIDQE